MGHVYLAEDTKLGRQVAIKLLPEEAPRDERAIEHDERGLKVGREINVLEAQANSLINLGIDRGRAGLESESTMEAFREVEAIFQRDSWFRWRYSIRLQAGKSEHALAEGGM